MKRKRSSKRKKPQLDSIPKMPKVGGLPASYWQRVKESREEMNRRSGFKRATASFVQGGAPGLKK